MSLANPAPMPDPGNVWLNGLNWGSKWKTDGSAKTTIEVWIAKDEWVKFDFNPFDRVGEDFFAFDTAHFPNSEAAILKSLDIYEQFLNIDFVAASSLADADLYFAMADLSSTPGLLGVASPPGEYFNPYIGRFGDFQSGVLINAAESDPNSTLQGGADFVTYIHEMGHAMGLAHPHDTGGNRENPSTVFPGVDNSGDSGNFAMNQGVFTMMSYIPGWQTAPHGLTQSADFGAEGTPMALDIAMLQRMYGANTTYRTGNDTYTLPSVNASGTFYSAIWDAGGSDTIVAPAGTGSIIDLRAATLAQAEGGGGFMSFIDGIHGGFTIANGVVIENARGAGGADALIGNGVRNVLVGNGGSDALLGFGGNDDLTGGPGNDTISGGPGTDRLVGGTGSASADSFVFNAPLAGGGRDTITDFEVAFDQIFLEDAIFKGLGTGSEQGTPINPNAFIANTNGTPAGPEDRILYSRSTGELSYDPDGSGTGADIPFALLQNKPQALAATDFELI